MTFYIARLKEGENYKNEIIWPEGLEASIPFSDEIIKKNIEVPRKESVQLYWGKRKSNIINPLVWTNDEGQQECAVDIPSWLEILKYESYRLEHKKPLRTILPFNYHNIPEKIRFLIISSILRFKINCISSAKPSPISQFNIGCETLLRLCGKQGHMGTDLPLLVLTHDIETVYGFGWIEKISRLEEKFGFRSLWNVVPNDIQLIKMFCSLF